jgi:hypothetical protein
MNFTFRSGRKRTMPIVSSVILAVMFGAILVVILAPGSPAPQAAIHAARASGPLRVLSGATASASLSQPTVKGYTSAQATSTASQCANASGSASYLSGGVLVDTASDASGSSLVVATPTGWSSCVESVSGNYTAGEPFKTYAASDGWGFNNVPAGDAPADWLTASVEVDAINGGLTSQTSTSGWLEQMFGRVSSGVTAVSVQMPDGTNANAVVQNGFFVARVMLTARPTSLPSGGVIPVTGYDSAGSVVYSSTASPPSTPQCFVTPSGTAVTPGASSASCAAAQPAAFQAAQAGGS